MVLVQAEAVEEAIANFSNPKNAKLIHQLEASTWEEAQTLHYLKMGHGMYKPMGEPEECPNGCGAIYYPEGSGECPNCGQIC